MKQWIFNVLLVALIAPAVHSSPTNGGFKKEIRKEFAMDPSGIVAVSNKYGKVQVHAWNKPVASFQIVITVDTKSAEEADQIFEAISINFSHSTREVKAHTEITSKPKNVWSWWWDSGKSSDFRIDYVVYIPEMAQVDLQNKYGDIYIDPLANLARIQLSYGNLRMAGSSDNVDIDLGYSKANIAHTANLSGNAKYSTLKCSKAQNVSCNTKYSKVEFSEANEMNVNSKYDTYVLGKISSIKNEGKYDDFEINEVDHIVVRTAFTDWDVQQLNESAVVDMKYGAFKVYKVNSTCEKIDFFGSHAQMKLGVKQNVAFQIVAQGLHSGVNMPGHFNVTRKVKEGQMLQVEGFSLNPNAKLVITADVSYGGVTIF